MNPPGTDADAFRVFEVTGWGQHGRAETYHQFFGPLTSRAIDPLLEAVGVGAGMRVLDVGSGPGYVAAAAAARGASVAGVDATPRMLELATRLHPGIEFRQSDAELLPFPDDHFDAVVANFLVPHLGRPEVAVAEFARVLRPDASLALTAWGLAEGSYLKLYTEAVQAAGAVPPTDLPAGPSFFAFADDRAFAELLRSAGLQDVEVRSLLMAHPITSPREVWDGLIGGTVRNAALIRAQSPVVQERIRDEFEQRLRGTASHGKLELSVEIKLACGTKAGMASAV